MVGIGSEVKGHVKREQMEVAAHGGRWTSVWEMERWDGGGGRKEGQMIRRQKEGVALGLHSSIPERTPSLGCGPLPCFTHGWPLCALARKTSWEGSLCRSVIGFAFTPALSPFFCRYFVLLDLYLFPSPPSAFFWDLFKGIVSHHHEFCSYFVLFPSKSISASVLCVQRLDQTGGNFWRVIFLLITPGGVSDRWSLPTLG